MKITVGLGNPGEKFKNTRHNVGFLVVDKLAEKLKINNWQFKKKFRAEILECKNLILVKPQIFMNDSGIAVKKIASFYQKTLNSSLLITNYLYLVHDELDLNLGEYKIQFGRGAAGHKGVESVTRELGTKDFWRVRVGIGPSNKAEEQFVLEKFGKEEKEVLEKVIEKVTEALVSRIK